MAKQAGNGKLTHAQFFIKSIQVLRSPGFDGIHCVFSGFNQAFKEYFPDDDVREVGVKLAEEGVIRIAPCRKGVMIFDGSVPFHGATRAAKANATLARILG